MEQRVLYSLKTVGIVLIVIGVVAAFYAPMEIFVFSFFSPGGQFHYEGFGFGSIWFGVLAVLDLGYFIVAALFLPVGIGHLTLRRWALALAQLYQWFWLGAGILIVGNLALLTPAALQLVADGGLPPCRAITIAATALLLLIIMPALALFLYHSQAVRSAFTKHDSNKSRLDDYPLPMLALLLLFVILILVLHLTLFFQSLFPLFGRLLLGRQAVPIVASCIVVAGVLMAGILRFRAWAWWGSFAFLSLLTVSTAMSFSSHSFYKIVLLLNPPAYELDLIDRLRLFHDFHLTGLLVPPLLIALGLVVWSGQHYSRHSRPDRPAYAVPQPSDPLSYARAQGLLNGRYCPPQAPRDWGDADRSKASRTAGAGAARASSRRERTLQSRRRKGGY